MEANPRGWVLNGMWRQGVGGALEEGEGWGCSRCTVSPSVPSTAHIRYAIQPEAEMGNPQLWGFSGWAAEALAVWLSWNCATYEAGTGGSKLVWMCRASSQTAMGSPWSGVCDVSGLALVLFPCWTEWLGNNVSEENVAEISSPNPFSPSPWLRPKVFHQFLVWQNHIYSMEICLVVNCTIWPGVRTSGFYFVTKDGYGWTPDRSHMHRNKGPHSEGSLRGYLTGVIYVF